MEFINIEPVARPEMINWTVTFFPTSSANAEEMSVVVEALDMEDAERLVESWFPNGFVSHASPTYLN